MDSACATQLVICRSVLRRAHIIIVRFCNAIRIIIVYLLYLTRLGYEIAY